MQRKTVTFTAPGRVEIRRDPLPSPGAGEVLVETLCSAISPGTEMLVYRGQFPKGLPVDECFPGMDGPFAYPLAYGYACVGVVRETGKQVDRSWRDRLVFAFQPHTSHFAAKTNSLLAIPNSLSPETAVFLPNMETAVNLAQDAAPILGERVLVFGQGIIGLLTAALLTEFPLASLVTSDLLPLRRAASSSLGVTASLDPAAPGFQQQAGELLPGGADLTIEVSGSTSALDAALALTRFSGRVVVGSWYGQKSVALDLGGTFHRSRIRLISSQVSTIAPELSARWDKSRRFEVAWEALARLRPEKWITHRIPLDDAEKAYRLLDENPQETIQIIFTPDSKIS
ncbi:MAG: zinc-binding alcohol dehydrogenase [Chloroflexota bacterium]